MTAILEHSFKARDEKRTYLCLKPKIAPTKVSILPLQQDERFDPIIAEISNYFLIFRSAFETKIS
jgi:glycyl-tRNA synthetase (class II)